MTALCRTGASVLSAGGGRCRRVAPTLRPRDPFRGEQAGFHPRQGGARDKHPSNVKSRARAAADIKDAVNPKGPAEKAGEKIDDALGK